MAGWQMPDALMASVVEVAGIAISFFIMGGGVLALAVVIAIHIERSGAFQAVGRE
jgi:hypothetical protein